MQLTGDFALLKKWVQKFEEVPKLRKRLPKVLSEHAVNLVRLGFRRQADPYGAHWAGTIRGGQILRDTGLMMGSIYALHSSEQFMVGIGKHYASTHQYGKTIKAKPRLVKFKRRRPIRTLRRGSRRLKMFAKSGMVDVEYIGKALTFKIGDRWISKESVKIPRRMMVPSAGLGLPDKWAAAFARDVRKILRRHFK